MTNQLNDHLAKVLGLNANTANAPVTQFPVAVHVPIPLAPVVERANTGNPLSDDATYARENLYDVVKKSQEAVTELMEIAKQSQHPRSFEVLNMLLRTQAEVSQQLIALEKERQEAAAQSVPTLPAGSNVAIANAVFVGTTADMLALMQGRETDASTADQTDV